jgi:hypothetical protein
MLESFRWLVRQERDKLDQDPTQPNRLKAFSYGLIYDALGWTKLPHNLDTVFDQLDVLVKCLRIAEQPAVSEEEFMTIRQTLQEGGFNVAPPMGEDNESD